MGNEGEGQVTAPVSIASGNFDFPLAEYLARTTAFRDTVQSFVNQAQEYYKAIENAYIEDIDKDYLQDGAGYSKGKKQLKAFEEHLMPKLRDMSNSDSQMNPMSPLILCDIAYKERFESILLGRTNNIMSLEATDGDMTGNELSVLLSNLMNFEESDAEGEIPNSELIAYLNKLISEGKQVILNELNEALNSLQNDIFSDEEEHIRLAVYASILNMLLAQERQDENHNYTTEITGIIFNTNSDDDAFECRVTYNNVVYDPYLIDQEAAKESGLRNGGIYTIIYASDAKNSVATIASYIGASGGVKPAEIYSIIGDTASLFVEGTVGTAIDVGKIGLNVIGVLTNGEKEFNDNHEEKISNLKFANAFGLTILQNHNNGVEEDGDVDTSVNFILIPSDRTRAIVARWIKNDPGGFPWEAWANGDYEKMYQMIEVLAKKDKEAYNEIMNGGV